MSTIKISALTALPSASNTDLLLITDTAAGQSKKITIQDLFAGYIKNVVEDSSPQLGGTLDANGNFIDMGTNDITDTKVGQWDTAYGWGDHASAGYADGTNESNWNTAYGWGDHSTVGYLTSFTETDPVVGAVTGIVKADGVGNISAATAGTDYLTDSSTNTLTNKSGNISQWTNDSGYLTSFTETNDLTAAVTWANIPDANVPQSAVTQHQAALSITESQISDLGTYLEDGFSVTAGTLTTANITTADFGNYTVAESAGVLSFSNSGTPVMQLDASGGFTIL